MNDVVSGNYFHTDSMKIYLSDSGEFPLTSRVNFDVSPAHMVKLEFRQTNIKEINRGTETRQCKETPDYIDLVTTILDPTGGVIRKQFKLGEGEALSLLKQESIKSKCNCYSHQLPYTCNQTQLCYYAPVENRKIPEKSILDKITCHDEAYKEAELRTVDFYEEAAKQRTCEIKRYTATVSQTYWPEPNQYESFLNQVYFPRYSDRQHFVNSWLKYNHRVFTTIGHNMSDSTLLHSDLLIQAMMDQSCVTNLTKNLSLDDAWCSNSEVIRKNFMKIWVKPFSTKADVYVEEPAYEWPEVLSEIGGTMGLWMGMSLLTVIEIIELFTLGWIEYKKFQRDVDSHATDQLNKDNQSLPAKNDKELSVEDVCVDVNVHKCEEETLATNNNLSTNM